jgi:hypothetical protein
MFVFEPVERDRSAALTGQRDRKASCLSGSVNVCVLSSHWAFAIVALIIVLVSTSTAATERQAHRSELPIWIAGCLFVGISGWIDIRGW